jgi:hypothetical protein
MRQMQASSFSGDNTTAYTDDFEEAAEPSSITSRARQPTRSASVLSEVSEAYSEVEQEPADRRSFAESEPPKPDAVASVSGAVSEDFAEEMSGGSGHGSSDDEGGVSGFGALMDADDIGAMLIQDIPLEPEAPQVYTHYLHRPR